MDKELYTLAHGLYEHLESAKTDAALIYGFYEALEKAYAMGVTDHVDDARDDGYQDGYLEGHGDGFEYGFDLGKEDAQDAGYDRGYDEGYDDGWDNHETAVQWSNRSPQPIEALDAPEPVEFGVEFGPCFMYAVDFTVDRSGVVTPVV